MRGQGGGLTKTTEICLRFQPLKEEVRLTLNGWGWVDESGCLVPDSLVLKATKTYQTVIIMEA